MKIIYVVTSGSYSDYGINGMFSTKELATSYINLFGGYTDFNDIEEWELDRAEDVEYIKSGRKPYRVVMWKNGDVDEVERVSIYMSMPSLVAPHYEFFWLDSDKGGVIRLSCMADDEPHAIKITGEIRTQLLANNEWGKNKSK